jgi:UPF0716 protein FxsA
MGPGKSTAPGSKDGPMWLLVIFILVPLIEIGLFIQVGGWIGLWPTLGLVLLMALVGSWLIRSQGASALADVRRSVNDLGDPSEPIAHGALILFAGLLMITPGFFTDILGLLLLIRPLRSWVIATLARRFRVVTVAGSGQRPRRPKASDVIEGVWRELDDRDRGGPPSGWTRH